MEIPNISATRPASTQTSDDALRVASEKLAATFLAEMLDAAGLGRTPEGFGGGAGEDQFASFLVQEQAEQIVKAGGMGLAEAIFNTLKEKTDE